MLCLLCSMLIATTASAHQRTVLEAEKVALHFLRTHGVNVKEIVQTSGPPICSVQARSLRPAILEQDEPLDHHDHRHDEFQLQSLLLKQQNLHF